MKMSIYFIFVLLLCALPRVLKVSADSTTDDDNKIVGGYNVTIQEFPYQAYLRLRRGVQDFQCGGSIISTRYILTAAHCLTGTSRVTARVGSTYANSGGTEYVSYRFRSHPRYNPRTFDYDVAYVRFYNIRIDGVITDTIQLVSNGYFLEPDTEVTVSGWGATAEGGNVVETLMAVEVPVVSSENCSQSYNTITPRMFCAGVPEGGEDSCGGDSGGPVVLSDQGILVGIVSYGIGCARPGIPGVYTNVSSVRNWIRRNTGV